METLRKIIDFNSYVTLSPEKLGRITLLDAFLYLLRMSSANKSVFKKRVHKQVRRISKEIINFIDLDELEEHALTNYYEDRYEGMCPPSALVMDYFDTQGEEWSANRKRYREYLALIDYIKNAVAQGQAARSRIELGYFRIVGYFAEGLRGEELRNTFSYLPPLYAAKLAERMDAKKMGDGITLLKMLDPYLTEGITPEDLGIQIPGIAALEKHKAALIESIRDQTLIPAARQLYAIYELLGLISRQEGIPLDSLLEDQFKDSKKQIKTLSALPQNIEEDLLTEQTEEIFSRLFPPMAKNLYPARKAKQQATVVIQDLQIFLYNPNAPLALLLQGE